MTGKFRSGVNPFDLGCLSNWSQACFASMPPSYVKFRRKRQKEKDHYQSQLLLKMPAYCEQKNSTVNSKIIYHKRDKLNPYNRNSIKIIKHESTYPLMAPVATTGASRVTSSSSTNDHGKPPAPAPLASSSSSSSSTSSCNQQKKIVHHSSSSNKNRYVIAIV